MSAAQPQPKSAREANSPKLWLEGDEIRPRDLHRSFVPLTSNNCNVAFTTKLPITTANALLRFNPSYDLRSLTMAVATAALAQGSSTP
jgi:hypothetical protein